MKDGKKVLERKEATVKMLAFMEISFLLEWSNPELGTIFSEKIRYYFIPYDR